MNEKSNFKHHDLLIDLGFKHVSNAIYCHKLIENGRFFDFSASSKEGIIYYVFEQGIETGKNQLQIDLKNLLNIKGDKNG